MLRVVVALLLAPAALCSPRRHDTHEYYVLGHDPALADLPTVLTTLRLELVHQVGQLTDFWLVRHHKSEPVPAPRSLAALDPRDIHARRVRDSVNYFAPQTLRQRAKRAPPPLSPPSDSLSSKAASHFGITDPLFTKQWHLVNDAFPQHMMNITGVWEMGYTGKGVISSLVDDGLDYTSEDLKDNFDAADSYDFNDHQDLPTPKNYDDHHGTRCAGQIAAQKNNACGIGIAYNSKVAGVRILSGPISDVDEAAALNYGFQNVSIYSCSWGPPDNGQAMEGPNYLIKKAVLNGINNGRGGKGSIFVFASGNGAARGDQCNFDGYTNSIYSVTVSAVDYKGLHPYYSEPCAANMIVAYSSGSGQHIVTTDKGTNECATMHGGTSAAAPNAVGVFALALEARPELTWRDVQHLCVQTAGMINPEDPDWESTATGRKYSYKYGFGVLDGYAYVLAAKTWKLVKPQAWYESKTVILGNGTFKDEKYFGGEFIPRDGLESKITITKEALDQNNFEELEHINVKVWIQHTTRGDVEIEIVSPNGIKSVLGGARSADKDGSGYPGWIFMSVKHWGESAVGDWTLRVKDQHILNRNGTLLGWNMMLWGSTIDPAKAKKYEVPLVEDVLPPVEVPPRPVVVGSATSSTTHPKPTDLLPGDHGVATGENTKPAFTTALPEPTAATTPPDSTPKPHQNEISGTADVGWFSDMGNLVSSQKWFFGALGAVSVFGIGVGIFFWRRRAASKRANYTSLNADDDVGMTALGTSMSGPRTTRDLYDAFGEVSDDDDDETTALRQPFARSIGFHSGFLDDDEPSASHNPPSKYRDEPEVRPQQGQSQQASTQPEREGSVLSSPTGSGDGSWEHASRE